MSSPGKNSVAAIIVLVVALLMLLLAFCFRLIRAWRGDCWLRLPLLQLHHKNELHGGQTHNGMQNATTPPSDHSHLSVLADELRGEQAQNGQQNARSPSDHGHLSVLADELHGGQAQNGQQNASLPSDNGHLSVLADELHGGQAQKGKQNAPPPPPAFFNNNGGTNSSSSGPDNSLPPPPPRIVFTYEELERATDGFSDANLLGEGGFGYVHSGVLPNGKMIAVKQLKSGGVQEEREFEAEVKIISRVHHRHLVSLVGYCISEEQRLLVCEFVPNNTLHFHLHGEGRPTMDWPTRLKIALGSAKGLAYLHEDCIPKIIHRDIKGTNILLNFDFEVKIADFGLAKVVPDNKTHVSTRIMGTYGYVAPEYIYSGKLTDKSDVYSFGVILLELITGRQPVDIHAFDDSSAALVVWARPLLTDALAEGNYDPLVDPRLEENYNPNEMELMVACAAACVRRTAKHRPRMSLVVRVFEGDASAEDLNNGVPTGHSRSYSY